MFKTREDDKYYLEGSIDPGLLHRIVMSWSAKAINKHTSTATIYIDSMGGYNDTVIHILELLKRTYKHLTAVIVGNCHSAAAFFAMNCDEIVDDNNKGMILHTVRKFIMVKGFLVLYYLSSTKVDQINNRQYWGNTKWALNEDFMELICETPRDVLVSVNDLVKVA